MMLHASRCCVLLFAAAVAGQVKTAPRVPEPPTTLHAAWLFEVLDLDLEKATAAYTKVANDQRPGNLDRWVAVARLAELERIGVEVNLRTDLKDVPEPLRAPLASIAAPLPVAELLQRVQGKPEEVLQRIGAEAGRLPTLHPITPKAEEWRLAQIPSLRDLLREQNNRARGGSNRNSDWVNAINASDIVREELSGWQSRADALRQLWFANWQPPKLVGDPQPYLEKFRTNLDAWIKELEPSPQRSMLNQLRDTIAEKTPTDPAAALALVARLPIYAERLLGLAPVSR